MRDQFRRVLELNRFAYVFEVVLFCYLFFKVIIEFDSLKLPDVDS